MKYKFYLLLILLLSISLKSCNIKDRKTTIEIVDNNRHYYPILRGQEKEIVFRIKNTGKNPFVLNDIFTSCSCLQLSKKSSIKSIPVGREGFLRLNYTAISNIGYAKYYVTLYGNFDSIDKKEVIFDINIVPDALYTKDYEEIFKEVSDKSNLKESVDGKEIERRYYMDSDIEN
ncbi:DUF1573 domain-containing protein [Arenibacter latericius]|uniref:DUF1573 domain-containing protein n=1 Tax=Arenibacter latericius TaxID=86104 RepID=UPI0003F87828|nr:DUF1573 domain-containing protein [Arenibacter latericius]